MEHLQPEQLLLLREPDFADTSDPPKCTTLMEIPS